MFISELPEARIYNYDVEEEIINESNDKFSEIVSEHANNSSDIIYQNVIKFYGELAAINPIARFNVERISRR
jgi:hemerythrin superfamily protein